MQHEWVVSVSKDAIFNPEHGWLCDCSEWTFGDDEHHIPVSSINGGGRGRGFPFAIIHPSHDDSHFVVYLEPKRKVHTKILDVDHLLYNTVTWVIVWSLVLAMVIPKRLGK